LKIILVVAVVTIDAKNLRVGEKELMHVLLSRIANQEVFEPVSDFPSCVRRLFMSDGSVWCDRVFIRLLKTGALAKTRREFWRLCRAAGTRRYINSVIFAQILLDNELDLLTFA